MPVLRYLGPGLCFALALGLLAAGRESDVSPWVYYPGMTLYALACLWWIVACADAATTRGWRALAAIVPALLPLGLSGMALSTTDIAIMGILGSWPFTILSPLLSLGGGIWILSGRYIPPEDPQGGDPTAGGRR